MSADEPKFASDYLIEEAADAAHEGLYALSRTEGKSPEEESRDHQKQDLIRRLTSLRAIPREERNANQAHRLKQGFKELMIIILRERFGKAYKYTEEQKAEAKEVVMNMTLPPERKSPEKELEKRCRRAAYDILGRSYGREGYKAGLIDSMARDGDVKLVISKMPAPDRSIQDVLKGMIEKEITLILRKREGAGSGRHEKISV